MHIHYCDAKGHAWQCSDDCECICGLSMEGHEHTDCPVELRPCPEHESEQNQPMSEEGLPEGVVEIKFPADWRHEAQPHCECGCSEIDAAEVVGWCFHCSHVYAEYNVKIQAEHFTFHCPCAPEQLKQSEREWLARRAAKRRGRNASGKHDA